MWMHSTAVARRVLAIHMWMQSTAVAQRLSAERPQTPRCTPKGGIPEGSQWARAKSKSDSGLITGDEEMRDPDAMRKMSEAKKRQENEMKKESEDELNEVEAGEVELRSDRRNGRVGRRPQPSTSQVEWQRDRRQPRPPRPLRQHDHDHNPDDHDYNNDLSVSNPYGIRHGSTQGPRPT